MLARLASARPRCISFARRVSGDGRLSPWWPAVVARRTRTRLRTRAEWSALRTGRRHLDAGAQPPRGRGTPLLCTFGPWRGPGGGNLEPWQTRQSQSLVLVLPGQRAGLSFSRILLGPHLTHTSPLGGTF